MSGQHQVRSQSLCRLAMKLLIASTLLAASATVHLTAGAEFGGRRPALQALASEDTDEIEYSTAEGGGKSAVASASAEGGLRALVEVEPVPAAPVTSAKSAKTMSVELVHAETYVADAKASKVYSSELFM